MKGCRHEESSVFSSSLKQPPVYTGRAAFTLIEILLVVVIILIATGIAMPSFVASYRGARLRSSIRMVVMASRYARATAVLKQMDTAILFDSALHTIEVVGLKEEGATQGGFLDDEQPMGTDDEEENISIQTLMERRLADDVEIVEVSSDEGITEEEGIYAVNYFANGMCEEYTIVLRDDRNKSATIEIDPLSARAHVEMGP
jgi:prepilin-type N-terminal cleavage/methylation domain-containing protein